MTLEEYSLPNEVWKPITGYEDRYSVSNFGRLWNHRTSKPIAMNKVAPYKVMNGKKCFFRNSDNVRWYYACCLYKDGTAKHVRVHRLVAQEFCPNDDPINKTVVNHIDNDPLNNMAVNLEWASISQNIEASATEEQSYTRWLITKTQVIQEV